MKEQIKQAIKAKLIEMAIEGKLDGADLTTLNMDIFDDALKIIEEKHNKALSLISTVTRTCEEGLDGTWECSTDEGKEGFSAMIELLDLAKDELK